MEATVLLQGHARIGAWMAIDVHLKNDGPPISGELRLTGGTQGRTRFGTQVEAPTQSDQTHRLYVQPPGFGRRGRGQPRRRHDDDRDDQGDVHRSMTGPR